MDSKPVGYVSFRAVLSHMEANKRIDYAIRMPSIRKLEKVLPLRIEKLSFGENFFEINQIQYRLGVVRDYGTQEAPQFIQMQNRNGGCRNNVDKDGFEDKGTWDRALPGDIVMNPQEVEEELRDINLITVREQEISAWEMELVGLHLKLEECRVAQENRVSLAHVLHMRLEEINAKWDIQEKMEQIERARYEIQCYECLRDGTPLPFKSFIKLRIWDAEPRDPVTPINVHLELLVCTATLPTAMKAVTKFIFGNRKQSVHVDELHVNQDYIVRLPSDSKLYIRKLHVEGALGKVCDPLSSIIDVACLPLEEVFVECHTDTEPSDNFQPELARTAKKLVIGDHDNMDIAWLPVFQTLQNQYVTWQTRYQLISAGHLIELTTSWLLEEKRIGTTFTFHGQKQNTATMFFDVAEQQFPESYRKNQCITIPMTPFSKIQVTYDSKTEILEMKVSDVENEDVNVATKPLCSCSIN